jgi:hypothetical protein
MRTFSYRSNVISSLEIPTYFFSYVKSDEDYHHFNVRFSILQSDIVKKSFYKVDIHLQNYRKDLQQNEKKSVDNRQHIENMRDLHKMQINNARQKEKSIFFKTSVSFASYVDSNIRNLLKSGVDPQDIPQLFKEDYTVEPIKRNFLVAVNNLDKDDVKKINFELIRRHSMDPATIFYKNFPEEISYRRSLENFYTQNSLSYLARDGVYYGKVKKQRSLDRLYIKVPVKLKKSIFSKTNSFEVVFQLYETGKDLPVFVNTQSVDAGAHIRLNDLFFRTPILEYQNNRMLINQGDSSSEGFILYKKEIDTNGNVTSYVPFLKNRSSANHAEQVSIPSRKDVIQIYRCIPQKFSVSLTNGSFDSAVISAPHFFIDTTVLLVGYSNNPDVYPEKMKITLKSQPAGAAQFKIVRREQITNDAFAQEVIVTNYRNFDGPSTLILDETAQTGKIYKYSVYYKMVDGTIRESVSQLYRYIGTTSFSSAVSTRVSEVSQGTQDGEHSVRFVIETDFQDSEFDKIKAMFNYANILDEFRSSFFTNKEDFSKLFSHQIFRLNKKTGVREHFLDDSSSSFARSFTDDKNTRKKYLISPIDPTADYCYEICVSLRDPLTLLKDSVSSETKKVGNHIRSYSYSPYKWRQPSVLRTGTMLPTDSQGTAILEGRLLEDGTNGITANVTINSKIKEMGVSLTAERLDVNKVKLSLLMRNSTLKDYDHFVIIKEVGMIRSVLGTYYSSSIADLLVPNDSGSLIYYVVPVFSDYSVGDAARSQTIIVRPEEFIGR